MAGGTELIKDIQMGRVDIVSFLICEKKKLQINFYKMDFFLQAEIDDYLCHSDLTKDVRVLMALLRDKTPSIR